MALGFGVASGTFAARAAAGFARNLRRDIYFTIQTFSFSNLDKFPTSSLITRMTTDIMNVQNAFQMIIRMAVRAPVMLVLSFFYDIPGLWAWKHPHQDGSLTYTAALGDVRLTEVDFAYEEGKPVLRNVSVYAEPGQTTSLLAR